MNVLAICLSVGLLIGGGRPAENPATTPTPVDECDAIKAPYIYGPKTFTASICTAAAQCNANASVVSQLEESACKQQDNNICAPGTCSNEKKCRAQAATTSIKGVTFEDFTSTADPTCPAGQARCTAKIVIAEKGYIGCYCMCENK